MRFCTKFTQKRLSQPKPEQALQELQLFAFCVVNIQSMVDFENLKISNISLIWTFLKRNWISLAFWALLTLTIPTGKTLCFTEFSTKIHRMTRLAVSDVFHMFFIYLKNVIQQTDNKNERLLLSVTCTAIFELVFVLTFENSFS